MNGCNVNIGSTIVPVDDFIKGIIREHGIEKILEVFDEMIKDSEIEIINKKEK